MKEIPGHKDHYGVKFSSKIYKTNKCRWCGMQFERESIYCNRCGSCQYCGLRIPGKNRCPFCGNHNEESDNIKENKYIIH